MSSSRAMQQRYGTCLTPENIRRVWQGVTSMPRASKRELADAIGLSWSATSGALRLLRDAGYIDFTRNSVRAITIIIPFGTARIVKRES